MARARQSAAMQYLRNKPRQSGRARKREELAARRAHCCVWRVFQKLGCLFEFVNGQRLGNFSQLSNGVN